MANDTTTPRLHHVRFLIAAGSTSVALTLAAVADLVLPNFEAPHVVLDLIRAASVVLWMFWFLAYIITRILGPNSAAYIAGYVDGVSRRAPAHDRVYYSRR